MLQSRDYIHTPYADEFTPSLRIFDAGYEDFKTRKRMLFPRVQNCYIVHVVLSGQGTFLTGGREYRLSGGDVFMCLPQEEICYFADVENPYRYCWFRFDGTDADRVCQTLGLSRECAAKKAGNATYISRLFDQLFETEAPSAMKIKSVFYAVIAALEDDRPQIGRQTDRFAVRIRQYLEDNCKRSDLRIRHIAAFLNISHVYLCKIFKETQGVSAMQYLKTYRLTRAYSLLLSGRFTVAEAMYDCGYTDISHFSKEFKAQYGFSPGRLIRKDNG